MVRAQNAEGDRGRARTSSPEALRRGAGWGWGHMGIRDPGTLDPLEPSGARGCTPFRPRAPTSHSRRLRRRQEPPLARGQGNPRLASTWPTCSMCLAEEGDGPSEAMPVPAPQPQGPQAWSAGCPRWCRPQGCGHTAHRLHGGSVLLPEARPQTAHWELRAIVSFTGACQPSWPRTHAQRGQGRLGGWG